MDRREELVFTVDNRHDLPSGKPPAIDGNLPGRYYGYFQNSEGEQAVFIFDRASGNGVLRMGDAGWDTEYPVVGGKAQGVTLSPEETAWLVVCWYAATGEGALPTASR